jgi:hypothetical protein
MQPSLLTDHVLNGFEVRGVALDREALAIIGQRNPTASVVPDYRALPESYPGKVPINYGSYSVRKNQISGANINRPHHNKSVVHNFLQPSLRRNERFESPGLE